MARCNIDKSRGARATIEVFIAASDGKIGLCFGQIDVNRAGAVCQVPYCNGAHGMGFSGQLGHIMQTAAAVIHFGDQRDGNLFGDMGLDLFRGHHLQFVTPTQ